jgi:MoaA/NifB/PqqE/SkfB family radical SAM enzyme
MSTNKFAFVSLFITRKCNLACSYCNLPDNDIYEMSGKEWIKVIDRVAPYVEFFNLIGGEPTLHPDLPEIVEHLNKIGANYSMVTNGTAPHIFYEYLINRCQIKSLCVSMDELHPDDKKSESMKSIHGRDLVNFIRNETSYKETLIISSVISTIDKFSNLATFALTNNCKIALSVRQFSDNEYQFNSNNPAGSKPSRENTIEVLKYIANRYSSFPLLDPFEYYIAMLNRYIFKEGEWKCRHGLTPAIDSNGDLWACFDFMGNVNPIIGRPRVNLLKEKFTPDTHFEAVRYECINCGGCTWNCPMVSEMVYDGIVKAEFL